MKKTLIIAFALIMQICAYAQSPMWNNYGKAVQVKGGAGIVQFVEAILGYKPEDWSREAVYDKPNGYFHYYEEGAGHIDYYVSYWNRKDGKKLVIMSYDASDFGRLIKKQTSPWGCYSSFAYEGADAESGLDRINVDTGFRAYLYDEVKKQLVPLATPPFKGFDNPVDKHYQLILPQKGKDIRVREQKGIEGDYVYHTLKWNGMTFDFIREGNIVTSFFITDAKANIRTAPNGKIVYTTPDEGSFVVNIIKIENGWCLIEGDNIEFAGKGELVTLQGSSSGYWIHTSCLGANGLGGNRSRLFASPNDKSKVISKVSEDTLVIPIEMRGEWVKVRIANSKKEGWMNIYEICSNPLTNCC